MEIEAILDLWKADCRPDVTELGGEQLRGANLHEKYYRLMIGELKQVRRMRNAYKVLLRNKREYYSGQMSVKECTEMGVEPNYRAVPKPELQYYIEADREVQKLLTAIDEQQDKVDLLKSIIGRLDKRGFEVHDAIEWIKHVQGA